jgi:hypothetical protein
MSPLNQQRIPTLGGSPSFRNMNRSSVLDITQSTEPEVSFGSAYRTTKLPAVHQRAHSMPVGASHALGLRYIKGRLLRIAQPTDERFVSESTVILWNPSMFWRYLVLHVLFSLIGPFAIPIAIWAEGVAGARNLGFCPVGDGGICCGSYINLVWAIHLLLWLLTVPLLVASGRLLAGEEVIGVDAEVEVIWPLLLLLLRQVVIATKYGLIPEVELTARRRHRRADEFLQDELISNWAANLSERSLQFELDAADYREGARLAAATLEFSGEQLPAAKAELDAMLGRAAGGAGDPDLVPVGEGGRVGELFSQVAGPASVSLGPVYRTLSSQVGSMQRAWAC